MRKLILPVLAVLSLSLVACGGQSSDGYANKVNKIQTEMATHINALSDEAASGQDVRPQVTAAVTDAADELRAIKREDIPKSARDEHDAYVRAVFQLGQTVQTPESAKGQARQLDMATNNLNRALR
jgi:outer membrane murein-binding lipoprotein Lpp